LVGVDFGPVRIFSLPLPLLIVGVKGPGAKGSLAAVAVIALATESAVGFGPTGP